MNVGANQKLKSLGCGFGVEPATFRRYAKRRGDTQQGNEIMSDAAWYYAVGSEQRGPASADDVALLIGRGEIGPDTLVWREGMSEWAAARASLPGSMVPQSWVDGMSSSAANPPQVPTSVGSGGAYQHPDHPFEVWRIVPKRFLQFRGRARRSEYWYWYMIIACIAPILAIVLLIPVGLSVEAAANGDPELGAGTLFLLLAFFVGFLLVNLSVSVRRLHDVGRSGFWLLLVLVPYIGIFVVTWMLAWPGQKQDNKHGPA